MSLDLHFGNIGFKIPEYTEDQLLKWMGCPKLTPVVQRDTSVESDCLPKYIVKPSDITSWMPTRVWKQQNAHLFLQIIDFGNGLSPNLVRFDLSTYPCNASVSIAGCAALYTCGARHQGPRVDVPHAIQWSSGRRMELSQRYLGRGLHGKIFRPFD
jgi:hypothetical protein